MKVAIANRGEVAVRIIRACQELGYQSVLLASPADHKTLAARMADEVVDLGSNEARTSYLDMQKVVDAAKKANCTALHPGFGFLSENAEFSDLVSKSQILFIGPSGDVIRKMGNKISAKTTAEQAGVPVIPGYKGSDQNPATLLTHAQKIGFPVIIKAASGGGGKGMKVAFKQEDFVELCESAQREALAAFGSAIVFLEKYIEAPRHIEIQVLGDKLGNLVHLFERDCTVQRRHQKIIEETPSPALNDELRKKIGKSAVKLAKAAGYFNAGTVEFLLDKNNQYYFMELNTRLQVEHPVTELVCGVDLVKLQFQVATGKPLPFKQNDIKQRGHAFEVRLYAEDPSNSFLPSIGKIHALELPTGPGRRFDFGLEAGDEMTPFYDPMIGKLICWSETRESSSQRMLSILDETIVFGLQTNIEFVKAVFKNNEFKTGDIDTSFIEKTFPGGYNKAPLTTVQQKFTELARNQAQSQSSTHTSSATLHDVHSPWRTAGGWRP